MMCKLAISELKKKHQKISITVYLKVKFKNIYISTCIIVFINYRLRSNKNFTKRMFGILVLKCLDTFYMCCTSVHHDIPLKCGDLACMNKTCNDFNIFTIV